MTDRVQVIKWESPSHGGTQTDIIPTEIDTNEDGLDARSCFLQDDSSNDSLVEITRDASGNMTFMDEVVTTPVSLSTLSTGGSGITAAQHKVLRQLIHFIDEGPAEGFASGAYREVTGTVFPTAIIWYDDETKVNKIVEKLITWSGIVPSQIVWNVYDTDGSTLLATVSDAISYSSIFETSRTRTITVY